jgi:cell division protein ZapE
MAADEDVWRGFVPSRRFARVSFDSYQPDDRYPSQEAARTRLRDFAAELGQRRAGWWDRFRRPNETGKRAMYLDGGYGVGKTHLLAATYHAARDLPRFYLTFADLAYAITRLGIEQTLAALGQARLICIDEFELDDVAQTRMASMFLRRALEQPAVHVVTTSNTLPSDLGRGRFAAAAFQREIGEIADAFDVLSIDGEDYRHRHWDELARPRLLSSAELRARFDAHPQRALLTEWPRLAEELERVHPVHYGEMARRIDGLYLDRLTTIDDQAVALRLVHYVDKLYEEEVQLSVSSVVPLPEVFDASYRHGGYEKKYRRCLSRLRELIAETEHRLQMSEGIGRQVQLG